jgi:hypothetical protein
MASWRWRRLICAGCARFGDRHRVQKEPGFGIASVVHPQAPIPAVNHNPNGTVDLAHLTVKFARPLTLLSFGAPEAGMNSIRPSGEIQGDRVVRLPPPGPPAAGLPSDCGLTNEFALRPSTQGDRSGSTANHEKSRPGRPGRLSVSTCTAAPRDALTEWS